MKESATIPSGFSNCRECPTYAIEWPHARSVAPEHMYSSGDHNGLD